MTVLTFSWFLPVTSRSDLLLHSSILILCLSLLFKNFICISVKVIYAHSLMRQSILQDIYIKNKSTLKSNYFSPMTTFKTPSLYF